MSANHRLFMVAASAALIVSGRPRGGDPAPAALHTHDCAPHLRMAPDLVERRCVSAVGNVPHFVARDLEVHVPSDRRGELALQLRVVDGEPAVRLVVAPDTVRLDGDRPRHVGPGPLTVALSGERLSIESERGRDELDARVLDRTGRVRVETRESDVPLVVTLDRVGS